MGRARRGEAARRRVRRARDCEHRRGIPVGDPRGQRGLRRHSARRRSAGASQADQAKALAALAGIQNPLSSTPSTVQCIACHTATVLTAMRSADAGVDPLTLPGLYASPYDLSIDAGRSATDPLLVRGLGWRGKAPLISQRAANETAQALSEIEARYPAE